jgi:hypothetical protein
LWGLSQSIEEHIIEINATIFNQGKTEGFSFTEAAKAKDTHFSNEVTLTQPLSPVKMLTGEVAH